MAQYEPKKHQSVKKFILHCHFKSSMNSTIVKLFPITILGYFQLTRIKSYKNRYILWIYRKRLALWRYKKSVKKINPYKFQYNVFATLGNSSKVVQERNVLLLTIQGNISWIHHMGMDNILLISQLTLDLFPVNKNFSL